MTALASRATAWLLGLLALALGLRAFGLEIQSLWLDEFLAFYVGQQPLDVLIERASHITGQSPLYYLVMKVWAGALGGNDVTVVRSLSVFLGLVNLIQIYVFVRRFGDEKRARITLAILAVSPAHIYFSQEARMYPLLMVLILAIAHQVMRLVREPASRRPSRWVAMTLLVTAALYTHYYAVLFLGAIGLFVLFGGRAILRPVVISWGVAGILYLGWLPALRLAIASGGNTFIRFAELKSLYTGLVFALGYSAVIIDAEANRNLLATFRDHAWMLALGGLAFGFIAAAGVRALWRADRSLFALTMLVLILPLGLATGVSFVFPIISERYFTPALPFFAAVLAYGVADLSGWKRWAPLTVAAILVGNSLFHYYADPRFGNHDWRAANAWVDAHWAPGDELLFHPSYIRAPFEFYSREPHPAQVLDEVADVNDLPDGVRYWLVVSHAKANEPAIRAALARRFEHGPEHLLPRGQGIRIGRYGPGTPGAPPAP